MKTITVTLSLLLFSGVASAQTDDAAAGARANRAAHAATTMSAPGAKSTAKPAMTLLPETGATYEEVLTYIRESAAAGEGNESLPGRYGKNNMGLAFRFAITKAVAEHLIIGDPNGASPYLDAAKELINPMEDDLDGEMPALTALYELDALEFGSRGQELSNDCSIGLLMQIKVLGRWFSTPKACGPTALAEVPAAKLTAPAASVPAPTTVAGYSLGMPFADFMSATSLNDNCDKNCRKVVQRAESGQATWFETSQAKLCFEHGVLVEIDADGKAYRRSN
jgi:hypothetical protein